MTLYKLERLKREAAAKALLQYLHQSHRSSEDAAKISQAFADTFKDKTVFTQLEVQGFAEANNLPDAFLKYWESVLRALLEPEVKKFLKSLPLEEKAPYLKALSSGNSIFLLLEQHPEIEAYINVEVLDIDNAK